jgi:hypothetical protein
MAFKLKSPLQVNIQTLPVVEYKRQNTRDSSQRVQGMESSMFNPTADGEQELKTETNPKDQVEDQVEKADKGIPLGLNPKQEMRYKIRQDKRKLRGVEREKRQTAKAEKMSERYFGNKFGMTNMDLAEKRLNDEEEYQKKKQEVDKQGEVVSKKTSSIPLSGLNIDGSKKTSLLDMKGKPNRAGGPIKMLKSIEDNTPAKYKSVKKAARENLMSALAKQGEPTEYNKALAKKGLYIDARDNPAYSLKREPLKPISEIKGNPSFATPGTEFKATKPGKSNQPKRVTVGDRAKESVKKAIKLSTSAALKKGEPMKGDFTYEPGSHYDKKDFGTGNINTKSGKAKITKTKPKGKGGKVKMDRKVPTKF